MLSNLYVEKRGQPHLSNTAIIGISAFAHDTACCVVRSNDGHVLYASAEERLTNVKHDSKFPIGAFRQALDAAERSGLTVTDVAINVDAALFISSRLLPKIRELIPQDKAAETLASGLIELLDNPDYYLLPNDTTTRIEALIAKLNLSATKYEKLRRRLAWHYNWAVKHKLIEQYCRDLIPKARMHAIPHHRAHAASAFFSCGFDEATVLVMDGQGEADAISIFSSSGAGLQLVSSTPYPRSLGLLYYTCRDHLGFSLGDEYKVMGMAAYGRPSEFDALFTSMSVTRDGRIELHDNDCFYVDDLIPHSGHSIFKFTPEFLARAPRRSSMDQLEQVHFDFAASVQKLTEQIGVEVAQAAISLTGNKQLALCGGVALNGLMNDRIRRLAGCSELSIYPAAGDDGTATGAAQYVAMQNGARPAAPMRNCFFGGQSIDIEIVHELNSRKMQYSTPTNIYSAIAKALSQGRIVARFVGASEFGPRALGNRSILADPRDANMRDTLNIRIKHRESFRPFAPACLRERAGAYFDLDCETPFMLLICPVTDRARAEIPAVVHADGTSRVQTVDSNANPDLYRTITEFDRITGVPVVINTSFNVSGEAIVENATDAIESFLFMDIDYLAIGNHWVAKDENVGQSLSSLPHAQYLALRRGRFTERYPESLCAPDLADFQAAAMLARL